MFINKGDIEGTNSSNSCVLYLWIHYVLFYVCVGTDFEDLRKDNMDM